VLQLYYLLHINTAQVLALLLLINHILHQLLSIDQLLSHFSLHIQSHILDPRHLQVQMMKKSWK
jgi:hypothetical protein